jgi:hypothetical protein
MRAIFTRSPPLIIDAAVIIAAISVMLITLSIIASSSH